MVTTRSKLNSAWLADLNFLGVLQVRGSNAATFLQGQLTCDVKEVNEHTASLGACCDHKGRMLAVFRIWKQGEDYFLLLPHAMVQLTVAHLQKYAVFSRVMIDAVEHAGSVLEYLGDHKPVCKNPLTLLNILHPPIKNRHHYLIITKNTEGEDITKTTHLTPTEWEAFNIQHGLATIYPQTRGLFTPQMINLQLLGGVSFTKGCYVGQEIVARTEHLGKVKRHLYHAHIEHPICPQPGDTLVDAEAQTIGMVVAAAPDPTATYQLLAVMQDQALDKASSVYYQHVPLNHLTLCA